MLKKGTTCTRPLDKAGYWMPTVKWNGQTINPDRAVFYYRAGGKDHKKVKPFEAGLKMITNPGAAHQVEVRAPARFEQTTEAVLPKIR